jgi:hypothetical protein
VWRVSHYLFLSSLRHPARPTPLGDGRAGFTPAAVPANAHKARPRPSTRPRAGFEGLPGASFLAKRTEADFQAWRDQQERTERKYAIWKRGERLPSQKPNSLMKCPCGQLFDSHRLEETVVHVPHITASATMTVH